MRTRIALLFLSFLIVAACRETNADERFVIEAPAQEKRVNLQLQRYNIYHHLHNDIFLFFRQVDRFSAKEEFDIITTLYTNLAEESPVVLKFRNYEDGEDLMIKLQIIPRGEERTILLSSNYDLEAKKLLPEGADPGNAYARLYLPLRGKFIKHTDVYTPAREVEMRRKSPLDLANFYLMDENPENDERAAEILVNLMETSPDPVVRFIALLSIGQIQLIGNQLARATEILEEARRGLEKMGDDPVAARIFAIYEREYEMIKLSN